MDSIAHLYEHSLEVQLPIIKMLNPDARIVAVSIGLGDRDVLKGFANFVYEETKDRGILYLASSDMSHYVPADFAKKQDEMVIKAMEKLDSDNALNIVLEKDVSMCGIFPAYVMMNIARLKGAKRGEVIEYTNSGVITGDFNEVVAYLGMVFY